MDDLYSQLGEALQTIAEASTLRPRVGVVLGSGLGAFAETLTDAVRLVYGDIPHFPRSQVLGHAGELVLGYSAGVPCAVLSGRAHYYEGNSMERSTFGVRVLGRLGIKRLLLTNAAGGINHAHSSGDFMVINDHINLTGQNPLRGPNDERLGPRFFDMTCAYGLAGRQALHQAARQIGLHLHEGVYAAVAGPNYETPAEIRMLAQVGADAVGMSTAPEVLVARHMDIEVAALSVITNLAAGRAVAPLTHSEVTDIANRTGTQLCALLTATVALLGEPS